MSKKVQNYFACLEQGNNDDEDEVERDQEKSKTTPLPKKSNNQTDGVLEIDCSFPSESNLVDKIKNKKQILLSNFRPELLKSLCNALKNNSVDTIAIYVDSNSSWFDIDDSVALHLQQLLSIPRIQFRLTTCSNYDYHQVVPKIIGVIKNISHLKVKMTESAPLDKLLCSLSKSTKIEDLRIKRKFKIWQPKLNHLSKIGGFSTLRHLEIPVYDSECQQFFLGLKKNRSITTLNLSGSIIPAKFAQLLVDLLAENTSITSLSLSNCTIDDECFSIICKGLLNNKPIQTLNILSIKPFKHVDLSIVGGFASKKQLKELILTSYDSTIAKIFSVTHHLTITDNNFEALKKSDTCQSDNFAQNSRLTLLSEDNVSSDMKAQEVKDLFQVLNDNPRITSLLVASRKLDFEETIKQLTANKSLKSFNYNGYSRGFSYKAFCEMIERNDSLEELICEHVRFEGCLKPHHEDLLKSLQKNRSLTRVNLGQLYGQLENFKELLTVNKYISFMNNNNWQSNGILLPKHQRMREEIVELNERNQRNAKKRFLNRKMNSIILARSRVQLLPMEVWREIFSFVDARLEHFELFKQAMVRK